MGSIEGIRALSPAVLHAADLIHKRLHAPG